MISMTSMTSMTPKPLQSQGFLMFLFLAIGQRFLRKHDQDHMFARGKKQTAGNGMK